MSEDTAELARRQSDHDLLVRVDERLSILISEFKEMKDDTKDTIKDHDSRIDSLEKWRWYLVGLATAAGAVAGVVVPRLFRN
jgi:hypothetical protein